MMLAVPTLESVLVTIVTVLLVPLAIPPKLQTTALVLPFDTVHVPPPDAAADTIRTPAIVFVSVTPDAASGPLFDTVMV